MPKDCQYICEQVISTTVCHATLNKNKNLVKKLVKKYGAFLTSSDEENQQKVQSGKLWSK
jgi:hypothetical protein